MDKLTPAQEVRERVLANQTKDGLSRSLFNRPIASLAGLTYNELLGIANERDLQAFNPVTLDLTNAQTVPLRQFSQGTAILAINATDEDTNVDIRFDKPNNPVFNLKGDQDIITPFSAVYLSWAAQAGKSITLIRAAISDLFQIRDRRKLTSIDSINSIGSIPGVSIVPVGATAVKAVVSGNNVAAQTLHTVTTGKTLKLQYGGIVGNGGVGQDVLHLEHQTAAGALVRTICAWKHTAGVEGSRGHFTPPLEIPAGEKVVLVSRSGTAHATTGNIAGTGFISGWEV